MVRFHKNSGGEREGSNRNNLRMKSVAGANMRGHYSRPVNCEGRCTCEKYFIRLIIFVFKNSHKST